MSSDVAIKVSNVSKHYHIYDKPLDRLKQSFYRGRKQFYKEFKALDNISFEVKRGETVGIIGRNGAGKSTLLQMICGTLTPTSGDIKVDGRVAALLELGAGFNAEFTGRENVFMNAALLGLSKKEIDERYEEILEFADIGDFINQPVKTYSSGMYVRLAFAIQANVEPEVLIVDEALAVGDAQFVHRCMLRFNELQKIGTTILFVSHDANSVRNLCSRAIWLADGGIKEEGDSSRVVDAYLAHIFGQQVVTANSTSSIKTREVDLEKHAGLQMETEIPNIDRRLGDQRCEIIGVGLYDESMNCISSSFNEKNVILRLTIKNNSIDSNTAFVVGYIFRNAKGQEIASTNSQIEEQIIKPVPEGGYLTIRMKVALPCLYPGSYAFTVTAGYIEQGDEIMLSDRIENAIIFDVLSKKKVHVMMSFSTTFEVEL